MILTGTCVSYRVEKLEIWRAHTHTHTDIGNDITRRPKLASGKNDVRSQSAHNGPTVAETSASRVVPQSYVKNTAQHCGMPCLPVIPAWSTYPVTTSLSRSGDVPISISQSPLMQTIIHATISIRTRSSMIESLLNVDLSRDYCWFYSSWDTRWNKTTRIIAKVISA